MRHYNTGRMNVSPPGPRASAALAWAGGALFVVALAWCFAGYLFGMPAAGPGIATPLTSFVINAGLVYDLRPAPFGAGPQRRQAAPGYRRAAPSRTVAVRLDREPPAHRGHGPLAAVAWHALRASGAGRGCPTGSWCAAGFWITVRAAGVLDPLELAGIRQVLGTSKASAFRGDRPVSPGPASDLSGVDADRVRGTADDGDATGIRRRQLALPGAGRAFRRASARRRVRRHLPRLPAAGALADLAGVW